MCGRYTLQQPEDLQARFNTSNEVEIKPNYNAAPGQLMPVILRNSPNRIALMKWGLVPSWAKDPKIGYKMINARSEGIQDKPSFRHAIKTQRCIVPASGYYEWKMEGKEKVPYLFRLKEEELFGFAGLYEHWHDGQGNELDTFTIITTSPNEMAAKVHDRMPVILRREDEVEWLDTNLTDSGQVVRLLGTFDKDLMESYQVSAKVGSPSNNNESLVVKRDNEEASEGSGVDSK